MNAWYLPWQLWRVFKTSVHGLARAVTVLLARGLPYARELHELGGTRGPIGRAGLVVKMGLRALVFLVFGTSVILGRTDRALWRANVFSSRGKRDGREPSA